MNELLKPILLPVICGVILLFIPKDNKYSNIRKIWAIIFNLIVFIFSLKTIFVYNNSPFRYSKELININDFNLNILLFGSYYRILLVAFINFFSLIITIYSYGLNNLRFEKIYYPFILFITASANTVILANNIFLLFICWEIATLLFFYLISFGNNKEANLAAGKMFSINGCADFIMLIGILLIWRITKNTTITDIKISINLPIHYIAYFCLMISAMTKAGAIPFHTWIPDTCNYAPITVAAFLPSAIDKILGIYLLALISINLFIFNSILSKILMIIGSATIIIAVLFALIQHNAKRLLAFHLISQVGYMILGIGTGQIIGIIGGIYHMINHTIYKSCLLLGIGAVEQKTNTTELDRISGLGKNMPFTFLCMSIAALSISGIPPFNGFVSKWIIYNSLISGKKIIFLIIAMFGSALTLASFIKLIHSVFLGNRLEYYSKIKEVNFLMYMPMLTLALLCIILGLFPNLIFSHIVSKGIFRHHSLIITDGILLHSGEWQPIIALLFMILAYFIGIIIYFQFAKIKIRKVNTFIGGEIYQPEETHFSGTQFFLTIKEFPILKDIYSEAEKKSFDISYFIEFIGSRIIEILKFLHNGILSNYLSWTLIGILISIFIFIKF
ncbi:MAG TPA: proton-conducting transporter membrane subunit [bacterium]|nr:proton-conducting transporter membrane subunit [bacterium]HOL47541.1 proton-conducting transporter membrane subunit [bacterium]HPQ19107.1 proton-conducting transporter membrane subunit [bacterium]